MVTSVVLRTTVLKLIILKTPSCLPRDTTLVDGLPGPHQSRRRLLKELQRNSDDRPIGVSLLLIRWPESI